MKGASLIALAALLAPAPLLAMPSLHCGSPQRGAPSLYVSVGSGGGVDHLRIIEGRRHVDITAMPRANPRIVHGFMDDSGRLSVRILRDGNVLVASLELPGGRRARPGLFRYRGQAWRISCRWDQTD